MLSKGTKTWLVVIAVVSLLCGLAGGWVGHEDRLSHVTSTLPQGETTCLTDLQEEHNRASLIRTDREGRELGSIDLKLRSGRTYLSLGSLLPDGDEVYILTRTTDAATGLILEEAVSRCNFDAGKLEKRWVLPVADPAMHTNLAPAVHDGILYVFRSDYSGKEAEAALFAIDGEGAEREVLSFRHEIGVGFSEFYAGTDGAAAFTTPEGEIWRVSEKGKPEKLFPQWVRNAVLAVTGVGNQLYVSTGNGPVLRFDLSGDGRAETVLNWKEEGLSPYELKTLAFGEDGSFSAAVTDETAGTGLVTGSPEAGAEQLSRVLKTETSHQILTAVICFAGVWAVAAVLALLRKWFLFLTRGKVPVVTKLLSVFLPILIISLLLMNHLATGLFQRELVDRQFEKMYLLTGQQTATLNDSYIREITPANAYESVYFYEIREALNVLPTQGSMTVPEENRVQETHNSGYFWLYKLVNGKLVSLVCEQNYVGVPVESQHDRQVSGQFYRAVETGEAIRTEFTDSFGDWTVLLTPVKDERGEVVAVIETGDSRLSLDYAVEQSVRQLNLLNVAVLIVLAVLLSLVIAVALHPLGILKRRVDEISEGKLGVQAPVRGRDEVAEITRAFNTMSHNVAARDREIRATSEGYSRFVPAKVFDLLEKSSVIDVRLADQTDVEATVLSCSVGAFDQIARSLRSKQMFQLINRVLAGLVPIVNETGGMVDHFDKAGLLAIYTDRPEQALDAAVKLCQTIRTTGIEEPGGENPDFHVTLSSGPAMIGIVGAEERLEAMTVSEHTSFAGFLRPLAAEYGAGILMTGTAAGSIPDFDRRYHARTIGFVYMKTLDKMERLYDVYDGDDEVTRQLKQETAVLFEKGVALYCSRQYYDARLSFIEVLKRNRRDLAARQYLYLCDAGYRGGTEEPDIYLESY